MMARFIFKKILIIEACRVTCSVAELDSGSTVVFTPGSRFGYGSPSQVVQNLENLNFFYFYVFTAMPVVFIFP
jgi:hypothetical protein